MCDSCRLARWIIISTQDQGAADICSATSGDETAAICIVYGSRGAKLSPSSGALVAADEAQLTALLAAHDADFTLCVVPPDSVSEVRFRYHAPRPQKQTSMLAH